MKNRHLIPSSLDVDGVLCFKVFVPRSTNWVIVFKTALANMERGRYWNEDTGIVTDAQTIARAINESVLECDCGSSDTEAIEEVLSNLSQLEAQVSLLRGELDRMNVYVNNYNGGCGCNGNGVSAQSGTDGDFPIDGDVTVPPYEHGENQPDGEFDDWKCQSSSHVVAKVSQFLAGLRQMVASQLVTYNNVGDYVGEVFGEMSPAVRWSIGLYTSLVTFVTNVMTVDLYIASSDWVGENGGQIADALYCGETPLQSYNNVRALIAESNLPTVTKYVLYTVFLVPSLSFLFRPVGQRIQIPSYDHACNCGGASPTTCTPIDLPEGFGCVIIPLEYDLDESSSTDYGSQPDGSYFSRNNSGQPEQSYYNTPDTELYIPDGATYKAYVLEVEKYYGSNGRISLIAGDVNENNADSSVVLITDTQTTEPTLNPLVQSAYPDYEYDFRPRNDGLPSPASHIRIANRFSENGTWSVRLKLYMIYELSSGGIGGA